jgi:MFS family permease
VVTGKPRSRTPFAALLTAYLVSVLGTSMSALAIPWLVLTTTGSAATTGLVAFAQMTPYVLAQALSGPVADRAGPRRCLVAGNAIAAPVLGAIPLLHAAGALSLTALIVLAAVAGLVRGVADTANGALVPATAEQGGVTLERAAGLSAGANRTGLLVGAPLAGVLVTVTGPAAVVVVNAGTFAVAALLTFLWVRTPGETVGGTAPGAGLRGYVRDLAVGLRFIAGDRLLLGVIAMVAGANLLDQGLSEVMLPVWASKELGSAGALGLLAGAAGAGSLAGNLLGAWAGPRLSRRTMYAAGFLLGGAPRFLGLALAGSLGPAVAVLFVADVFGGLLNPVIGATTYERIPEHLRARVLGAIRASAWVGIPLGALAGGYATELLGVRTALTCFGVAYLLISLAPLVFPVWRQLRRPDPVTV